MSITILIFAVITLVSLIVSLVKDKKKTFDSMKGAKSMMGNLLSELIAILLLIGLVLTFIPTETISRFMGESNTLLSTIGSALVGTVTLIPAFVAFPLAGSLVDQGASLIPIAGFITTLTMVGFVTFPLERREFGLKFAISRNALSFVFAILIAMIMGVLL
ncbi:permease [Natronospora cellulosivora (SeqCode)]